MNNKSRVENSIRNSASGLMVQASNALMGLIVRTVFIHNLSSEYLGVNGLFSNILTMLSLAEMGIGGAITYSMYKPIATKDEKKIAQLMNMYRTAYRIVGAVVATLGVSLIPFLGIIIKDKPNIEHLTLIYLLYLSNTVLSYFFAYKRSIFSADQMERIINYFTLFFQVIRYSLQVLVIILFRNFIAYLAIQISCTVLENIALSRYADIKYPFLQKYRKEQLEKTEKSILFDNIKALFIYKIGSRALDGTDNIIISAFDGVISVGLLSNYALLTGALQAILSKISNSLTGSVGNYIAKENPESFEQLLENITFVHFILYGMLFVGGTGVLNPFVSIWAGEKYLLSESIVFVHCLNIYILGLMNSIWLFRSTMGLFVYGRWRPLISAIINVVVSIILAKQMGLIGVLLGTTITRITTNVWFDPYIVFKYGMKKSPIGYYLNWIKYLLVIVTDYGIIMFLKQKLLLSGIGAVVLYGTMCIIIFAISVLILYRKSKQFSYFTSIMRRVSISVRK